MPKTRLVLMLLLLTLVHSAHAEYFTDLKSVPDRMRSIADSWPAQAEDGDAFVDSIVTSVEFLNTWLEFVPEGLSYIRPRGNSYWKKIPAQNLLNVYRARLDSPRGVWNTENEDHDEQRFFIQAGAALSQDRQGFSLLYWDPKSGHTFILQISPYGKPGHFALWWPTSEGSRAVEVLFYPDGKPYVLGSWENSSVSGLQIFWEPTRKRHSNFGPELFSADPRLHPDQPLSTPPTINPQDPFGTVRPITDVITISFFPPNQKVSSDELFPRLPRELPILRLPDSEGIPAPVTIPGWAFVAWTKDEAAAEATNASTDFERGQRMTAHYDGPVRFSDPQLNDAVYEFLGIDREEQLTLSALSSTRELDLSELAIKSVSGLSNFTGLKKLNLSDNLLDTWKLFGYGDHLAKNLDAEANSDVRSPLVRLILLTQMPPVPLLEELILDGNPFGSFKAVSLYPSLRLLSLNGARLGEVPHFYGSPSLESVSLANNQITRLTRPPDLPALKTIDLSDNQLLNLDPWVETDWAIPGLEIQLEGNQLTESTLTNAVPELESRGMRIRTSAMVSAIDEDADPDKDGYSNLDERTFARLFSVNQAEIDALYTKAIQDPEIPRRYLSLLPEALQVYDSGPLAIESIPVVTVGVSVEGKGSMYPGPGQHSFAVYLLKDDYTWEHNTLLFEPIAESGWQVERKDAWRNRNSFEIVLNINRREGVHVKFVPGPVEFEILPTDAISAFVERYFPDEDLLAFDMNESDWDFSGDTDRHYLKPNGLPDMAEAAVLQLVLQTPDYAEGRRGAVPYGVWCDIWFKNLSQARQDVKERDDLPEWAADIIAVYTTLGQRGTPVKKLLKDTLNVDVDMERYVSRLHRYLGPNSGLSESDWYQQTYWERATKDRAVDMDTFGIFAALVLEGKK